MNALDPQKRVDLIVDEWGTWFDVEPGTNPGFLYQLNTMRDAMVAALTLNIFNKHADRVQMANIAQTVNVLQAVILTEGDKMVLTPTYHVFKMYKDHQQNTLIGSYLTNSNTVECEECSAPQMIESASVDENGTIYATVTNISATKKAGDQVSDRRYQSFNLTCRNSYRETCTTKMTSPIRTRFRSAPLTVYASCLMVL